jgi:E3 ubiquitin-protein ligase SHPRH
MTGEAKLVEFSLAFRYLNKYSQVNELARAAQLTQRDESLQHRLEAALDILAQADREANNLVQDLETAIAEHDEKGEALKREALARKQDKQQSGTTTDKGRDSMSDVSDMDEDEDEDGGLPKTPAGEEHRHKKAALQNRLRDAYLVLHKVKFLQGDVNHALGQLHEADESTAYAAAEELRKRLLKSKF